MANVFVNLPVPAGDGVGAWVDVSGMAPGKTISVDGGAFSGQLFIDVSNDGQVTPVPLGIGPLIGGLTAPQDVEVTANWMRVRRTGSGSGPVGTPSVNLASAPPGVANVFAIMNIPAGDGDGTSSDLSAGGPVNTFSIGGPFTGQLIISVSADGTTFSPAVSVGLAGQTTPTTLLVNVPGVVKAARVRRQSTIPGQPAPAVSVGSGSDGGGGTSTGIGAITQGENIVVDATIPTVPVVSTVSTGFLQDHYSTDTVGPFRTFKKARGTKGAPLIVVDGDMVGSDQYLAYDGTQYLETVEVGAYVTPGATLAVGSIPTSLYVQVKPDGVVANPGNSATRVAMQLMPTNPNNSPTGGAIMALSFAGNTTFNSLKIPGGSNEVAAINVYGQTTTGPLSPPLAQFRDNSAAVPTHVGDFGWAFTGGGGNTAGSEQSFFELSVMEAGTALTAFTATGNATGGIFQVGSGSATVPAYSFLSDKTTGLSLVAGAGNDFDVYLLIGTRPAYKFYETASTLGNENHYLAAIGQGTGQGGFVVRGGVQSGLFFENVNGGIYLDAVGSSVQIGVPGVQASNATSGFLGINTMVGPPTGNPAFLATGKTAVTWGSAALGFFAGTGGTWNFVPSVASEANGTGAFAITALAPAGASATIQRWAKLQAPDGTFFTLPSAT